MKLLDLTNTEDHSVRFRHRRYPVSPKRAGSSHRPDRKRSDGEKKESFKTLVKTLFSGRLLLARIGMAEAPLHEGSGGLDDLLGDAETDEQRAEVRYRLWQLGRNDQAAPATTLYLALYEKTPTALYARRIEEMKAKHPPC